MVSGASTRGAGVLEQAATSVTMAATNMRKIVPMFQDGSWILILEALGAGGLLVFIVWWTLPKKRPGDDPHRRHDPHRPDDPNRRDD